jgi:predicted porin
MQKKIIALAVAGLVSGAAFAQSNVTLYGIVDMGYQYSWDNNTENVKSMHDIKSGGLDGSRVGVKGSEDLGNGLKAEFDATWAFSSDHNSSVTMGEGSSVALSGNWGKVRAGYFGNFLDDNTGVDASGRHGMINSGSLYGTGKYSNFVAYYSPSFSGLQFKAGASSNANGADNTPDDGADLTQNVRAYTAAVSYENGPIKAGLAYAKYNNEENDNFDGSNKSASDWNAGVSYNFGVATVSVFGAQQKYGSITIPNGGLPGEQDSSFVSSNVTKKTFWALGAAIPVTSVDVIKLGYGQAKLKVVDEDDAKVTAWDIVYLHSLSKRTTAYAMYGNLGGDFDDANTNLYQQALNVGIRHTF